jgi:cell division septal protein FtsQ
VSACLYSLISSILAIIGGVLLIFGGLSLLAFAALFTAITFEGQQQLQPQEVSELQPLTQLVLL